MLSRSITAARRQLGLLDAEETFNSVTHALALVMAVTATLILFGIATLSGDVWRVASAAVYGLCIVFLFAASTVYHGVVGAGWKRVLRRVDHVGVKLLIAGSYTPFILIHLRDGPAIWMGVAVWALLFVGVGLQFWLSEERYYKVSLGLYLAMGFVCVPFVATLAEALPQGAQVLLAIGGALYVAGVVFFVWESLPFSHGIWHLFVIGGAGLHYIAVLRYAILFE